MRELSVEELIQLIKGAFLGTAVGDALGVPVEFKSRQSLKADPVNDYRGFGTYAVPAGTFSDDSSLTFCLIDAMIDTTISSVSDENEMKNMTALAGSKFLSWWDDGYWAAGPDGAFDIGISTAKALNRIRAGNEAYWAGGMLEGDNGNGALIRILPMAFWCLLMEEEEVRWKWMSHVAGMTHLHDRSMIACHIHLEFSRLLIKGLDPLSAYKRIIVTAPSFLRQHYPASEINYFSRILNGKIHRLDREDIESSGYVVHSLEAAFHAILTTSGYKEAVLKGVNLGGDTDSIASIIGGWGGIHYGHSSLPAEWLEKLIRQQDIQELCSSYACHLAEHIFKVKR